MKKIYYEVGIFFLCVVVCIIFVFQFYSKPLSHKESNYPMLKLKGKVTVSLPFGEKYKEKGYKAYDAEDGDLRKKVKVTKDFDETKLGKGQITYEITNSKGNTVKTKRFIEIKKSEKIPYKKSYDAIDNTVLSWGTNNKLDGKRPLVNIRVEELRKYNAYAMGEDKKVIYLTFDEGALVTYLPKIVDVLNENDVKGTFFLCYTYIKRNPTLIKKMIENGHSIGNHTANHTLMPTLATSSKFDKFLKELIDTENIFEEITGRPMDPIYREPRGEFSMRTLSIAKDLGYCTYFWSAAYKDWDDKLTKEEALDAMIKRVHNGAIYLLHPTSKGNYLALSDFIKEMKRRGYTFDLVKNIP